MLSRRCFLGSCAAAATSALPCSAASAPAAARTGVDQDLRWSEVALEGPDHVTRQALILVPDHGPPGRRYPALLLLHGRGEVGDARAGMHAWRSPYGLADSYAQLRRPPLVLDPRRSRFMRPAQLEAVNSHLAHQPFAGLVLVCPVTPNPHVSRAPTQLLDRYADWIEQALLPRVAALAPIAPRSSFGIDGCSLGGYVAAELFIRKPHLFRTFGAVQPAFGKFRVPRFARQLAALAQPSPAFAGIHLQTSTQDPYRSTTETFSRELERLQIPHALDILPGPHTQPWLRAAGTLNMLAWQERALRLLDPKPSEPRLPSAQQRG